MPAGRVSASPAASASARTNAAIQTIRSWPRLDACRVCGVGIRNARHKVLDQIKKSVKEGLPEDVGKRKEIEVQDLVNKYVEQTDKVVANKEREIMTV